MKKLESTDNWHKCTENTQGAYQRLTTTHTPLDVPDTTTIIQAPPPPYSVPRVGWQDPSHSELLAHSCTCCLPPDCCSSALFREHTHIGFHAGEVVECWVVIISLLCTVGPLTPDKCNSNLGFLFSPMNKTYLLIFSPESPRDRQEMRQMKPAPLECKRPLIYEEWGFGYILYIYTRLVFVKCETAKN